MAESAAEYESAVRLVAGVIDAHLPVASGARRECACGWVVRDEQHTWSEHLAVLVILETLQIGERLRGERESG